MSIGLLTKQDEREKVKQKQTARTLLEITKQDERPDRTNIYRKVTYQTTSS